MAEPSDAELVEQALAGNRDAFGEIVARYQSLLCSLAYSSTGSLTMSEDLAQEALVTAWKQLGDLREPSKLRSWLCGIQRNLARNMFRRQHREPLNAAETLEETHDRPTLDPSPTEELMSREEQAILWRAIERIPETYREPLVLFYRQHQSITEVAQGLELSEDTVKQRLSRGRKLLHEELLVFVEGALERSNPGHAFTVAVLASLPALTLSTQAAAGAVVAKGGGAVKATSAGGYLVPLIGPLLVLLSNYVGYRIGLAEARTEADRREIRVFYGRVAAASCLFFAAYMFLVLWACRGHMGFGLISSLVVNGLMVSTVVTTFGFWVGGIRRQQRDLSTSLARNYAGRFPKAAYEYRSRFSLLGLPLVHVRVGDRFALLRGPVTGWIAAGNVAVGGLFALGGIAIAPVSVGLCAVGLILFAGIGVGLFSWGALVAGVWALGATALGWQSLGACSIAWNAAVGSVAFARDFALGTMAHAAQANNETARQVIMNGAFFDFAQSVGNYWAWLNLLWLVPMLVKWRMIIAKRARS